MKKNLQLTALGIALAISSLSAQNGKSGAIKTPVAGKPYAVGALNSATTGSEKTVAGPDGAPIVRYPNRGCGTGVPDLAWEMQFQKQIQEYLAANTMSNGKIQAANYTIPVIIHVIHTGQAVGTYPNLQQGQLNSQIAVLNADYGGTGFNSGNYPATAFTAWASNSVALSASLTAANKDANGRVAIANCNVQFCLATKDTLGNTLTEPGIERINCLTMSAALTSTFSSKNPAASVYTNTAKFQDFIDNYIKKNTIWNVTKYLNMWVTDEQSAVGLLGYATFPVGSTNTGLSAPYGSATTDGFWAYAKAIGSISIFPGGTYDPTYKYGRTCTHEIGHWLGLRHIWGDGGQCGATDYCVDTPPQKGTTGPPAGCYYGTPTYPSNANTCTRPDGPSSASVKNLNGDMFMNFMDYTDDPAMYMFTTDQRTRIQTTMANSPYRKLMGTHGLCSVAASTPTAALNIAASGCAGTGVTPTNNSNGSPTPTYTWSTNPSTGVTYSPNNTATQPAITFANPGTYTVTVLASNTSGTSTASQTIAITSCTAAMACNDTLSNLKNTDTLTLYTLSSSTACPGGGYFAGNNCYGDKEKAEWYNSTGLVSSAKVVGGIVIFFRNGTVGTRGTGNVTFKLYNGNNTSGPSGAAINTYVNTLTNIISSTTATTNVSYCGDPGLAFSSAIMRPYSFNFATPTTITGDFIMSVVVPTTSNDTIAIMHNSGLNGQTSSTAWEMWSDNTWHGFDDTNGWGTNTSLAILPKIACITTGISDPNGISHNVAVFPNPSNGMFNFAVTMPKASDLQFTVINNLGQIVHTKTEKSVTNSIIGMDLSHLAKGIYHVTITDNNGDKSTHKLVIE